MKSITTILMMVFASLMLSGCNKILTESEVQAKVKKCESQKMIPWYTFVKQGDKESGVIFVDCRTRDDVDGKVVEKKESSLFDDDTPVTATGMPSMSGMSGGPF